MLKKAGIVVAAGAATLLAVSPLAFAGDKSDGGEWGGHHGGASNVVDKSNEQVGLVNVHDVNALNPQICTSDNAVKSLAQAASGALGGLTGSADGGDVTRGIGEGGDAESGDGGSADSEAGSLAGGSIDSGVNCGQQSGDNIEQG
ncbi:MAG: hypothetical protein L0I76_34705 [Pseudonocardia sp.]|nr:hypothetical protein [Pseudonocardia sp.]